MSKPNYFQPQPGVLTRAAYTSTYPFQVAFIDFNIRLFVILHHDAAFQSK